jgi:hypothetical protein
LELSSEYHRFGPNFSQNPEIARFSSENSAGEVSLGTTPPPVFGDALFFSDLHGKSAAKSFAINHAALVMPVDAGLTDP